MIKIFFSQPKQKHEVLSSLEIAAISGPASALEVLYDAASNLSADAIVFRSAPSNVQMRAGPTAPMQFDSRAVLMLPVRASN
jgi:hypothetical protein